MSTRDPLKELDRLNLLAALTMIGQELKRYNDFQQQLPPAQREPEFGRADYTNRIRNEQRDELHAQLEGGQEEERKPPRPNRRSK